MPSIEALGSGLVYRNPEPQRTARNATFPTLVRFSNGELLCALNIGESMHSLDRRSYLCRSDDDGMMWSKPVQILEPQMSEYPVDTEVRISRMPTNDLIGLVCLFQRHHRESGHSNPDTDGFVETQLATILSSDRGYSWSKPRLIRPPISWQHFELCSPCTVLGNGRLLIPTSILNNWEGNCSFDRYKAIAFLSTDNGATWPKVTNVVNLSAQNLTGWEQKQAILSDGRVMAICWCNNYVEKKSHRNRYAFSLDQGDSFGPPIECPIHGETNTILALPDCHVLSVYRRVDCRGLWAQLARIDGNNWRPLADCPLWGNEVESYESDLQGGQSLGVWKRMRTLRFGGPTMVQLANHVVLIAFWAQEDDGVSVIRWCRLKYSL